jgi:hypothetical protein
MASSASYPSESTTSENTTVGAGNIDTETRPRSRGVKPVDALISLTTASRIISAGMNDVAAAMTEVPAATRAARRRAIRFTPAAVGKSFGVDYDSRRAPASKDRAFD